MLIQSLSELPAVTERAVIINFNTKLVTTLALLSVIRHAKMPVLLIDCESTDGSLKHFLALMKRYDFDILTAPLRPHGQTLDWLFNHIAAEKVLLVDSDLEIQDSAIVSFFKDYIDEPQVFGCGFTNGPSWLEEPAFQGTALENALYHERPWIPLTLLKVAPIREALRHGKSFVDFYLDNEYSLLSPFNKLRSRFKLLHRIFKKGPIELRRSCHALKPAAIFYDTGAKIFEYLRYERLMFFVGLPEPVHHRFVTHFFGITRNTLKPSDTHGGGGLAKISDRVRYRLLEVYGEEVHTEEVTERQQVLVGRK
ncbi:MAG: hypothetical protein CLLPBCKN_002052 [Chroococcidiopsis cubana SAG 39.79]|uniref:Glycosyltransferase 2-like domain-containing protein n=1 Tax=Chroococcidiopsis cubana SAG 39.79 TaxID=388085 RepID=A0AB37UL41_9CYAN|nr:hypothetical protein [Chroococcidiopsis cubana]MDZ4872656.1 hypothetical protein [Chroococcidiopsis cubana SAG 39.79]PSB60862.1 hypothetical protein C7B79_24160 [Chroococcidiopsis cubana CCALA 043]RUT12129.1 hypothetical protein DSM107010_25440 [Chroococcidiopsis cubana SAG 39.79]